MICPDLPGHGQSLMTGTKLSIRQCGEAVLSIMDELSVVKAAFCGSSMGGATAMWLAKHHPDRVSHLILYRVNYRKTDIMFKETLRMANPLYWQQVGMDRLLSKWHMAQGGNEAWQQVIQRVSQALNPEDSDHGYTLNELAELTMPTLIACGDRDPLVPIEDILAMYTTIPQAFLWIMPNATHITGTNTWRAQSFADEIHRFLIKNG